MKKAASLALLMILVLVLGACGNSSHETFPSGFYMPVNFGYALDAGEYYQQVTLASASTKEEVTQIVEYYAQLQSATNYAIYDAGENDYYFQVRLRYESGNSAGYTYTRRLIVYKTLARVFNGLNSMICTTEPEDIRNLLDLEVFFRIYRWESARIISTTFAETETEYIYQYKQTFTDNINGKDKRVTENKEIRVNKNTRLVTDIL